MRSKTLLATLMAAGLVLVGCSGSDNENPTPNPNPVPAVTTVTGSTAWLNGSTVTFKGKTGDAVNVGKLNQGSLTFQSSLVKPDNGPYVITMTDGKLLNGKDSPFGGSLTSLTANGTDNLNANFATTLMKFMFDQLPAEQKVPGNINAVKQKTMEFIGAYVAAVYGANAAVSTDAVFGAPSPYSEQVLLTVMAALSPATADGLLKAEQSPQRIICDETWNSIFGGKLLDLASTEFTDTLNKYVEKTLMGMANTDKVGKIKQAVATVLKDNVAGMVEVNPSLKAEGDKAVADAEAGKLTEPPAGELPTLVFAFLRDGTNGSRQITEWHLNNSSATINVQLNGSLTPSGTQYGATGATFDPAYTGLTIKGYESSPGYFDISYANASAAVLADNSSATIKAVFPGASKVYKASELSLGFKVFQNASNSPAWVRFSNNKTMELPLEKDKATKN